MLRNWPCRGVYLKIRATPCLTSRQWALRGIASAEVNFGKLRSLTLAKVMRGYPNADRPVTVLARCRRTCIQYHPVPPPAHTRCSYACYGPCLSLVCAQCCAHIMSCRYERPSLFLASGTQLFLLSTVKPCLTLPPTTTWRPHSTCRHRTSKCGPATFAASAGSNATAAPHDAPTA